MTLIIEQAVRGLKRDAAGIPTSGRSDFLKAEALDLAKWSRALSFAVLGVSSRRDISELEKSPEYKAIAEEYALDYFSRLYGISGDKEHLREKMRSYSDDADEVIELYRTGQFERFKASLEMSEEVRTSNIVDLLILINNPKKNSQIRFEAKRKLYLMNIAAQIDARDRRGNSKQIFDGFRTFIVDRVFDQPEPEGLGRFLLVSQHDPETFQVLRADPKRPSTANVIKINEDETSLFPPVPGQKITRLLTRQFPTEDGKSVDVYFTPRYKSRAEEILKMVRKAGDNPEQEIQDTYGLMITVPEEKDVTSFVKRLMKLTAHTDYAFTPEYQENNFEGEERKDHTKAGAKKLVMSKFIANVRGVRIEIMFHTYESYINYKYQRGIAHAEFDIRRKTASEVSDDLLFPYPIYHVDFAATERDLTKIEREKIEDPTVID